MKKKSSLIFIFIFLLNACSTIEPDTERLIETSSIGAILGGSMAILTKVDPATAIIIGLILGYDEGTKINEKINSSYSKLKILKNDISDYRIKNERLKQEIKKKRFLIKNLSFIIEKLNNYSNIKKKECEQYYYQTQKAQYTTSQQIIELENMQNKLKTEIDYIEELDYNYEEAERLNRAKKFYKTTKNYLYTYKQIENKLHTIENITEGCIQ